MPVTLDEILNEMSEDRRALVYKRAQEIRDEINLRELRRLRKLTQARLSKKLRIGQEGVSRIEKRTDLYLSTLRSYVEAVGGKLSLIVEFPDQSAVMLAGFGENSGQERGANRRKKTLKEPPKAKAKTRRAA